MIYTVILIVMIGGPSNVGPSVSTTQFGKFTNTKDCIETARSLDAKYTTPAGDHVLQRAQCVPLTDKGLL